MTIFKWGSFCVPQNRSRHNRHTVVERNQLWFYMLYSFHKVYKNLKILKKTFMIPFKYDRTFKILILMHTNYDIGWNDKYAIE